MYVDVYTDVCIYIYVHAYIRVCAVVFVRVCWYAYFYAYVYVYLHVHVYVYVYVCAYVFIYVYVYVDVLYLYMYKFTVCIYFRPQSSGNHMLGALGIHLHPWSIRTSLRCRHRFISRRRSTGPTCTAIRWKSLGAALMGVLGLLESSLGLIQCRCRADPIKNDIAVSINLIVLFVRILRRRALPFGVCIKVPDFWKLPSSSPSAPEVCKAIACWAKTSPLLDIGIILGQFSIGGLGGFSIRGKGVN